MNKSLIFILLFTSPLLSAQILNAHDPVPFRQDQLKGRQFELDDIAFLHRFTYEAQPFLLRNRAPKENTFDGTAGSSSNDEFYLRAEARMRRDFDGGLFGELRYREHEDFDGWYERMLVGLGYDWGNWQLTLFADLGAAKSEVDTDLELRWEDGNGQRFQATVVLPDSWYNQKVDDGSYEDRPVTLHLSGRAAITDSLWLHGFTQIDPSITLVEVEENYEAHHEAVAGGAGLEWKIQPDLVFEAWMEAKQTEATQTSEDLDDTRLQNLDRDYQALIVELHQTTGERRERWAGARYLKYDEDDERVNDAEKYLLDDREEVMVYAGLRKPVSKRVDFVPGIYLVHFEHTQIFPELEEENHDENGFMGKAAANWEILLNEESSAYLAFNLTARLHRWGFGGGNIQFVYPFD